MDQHLAKQIERLAFQVEGQRALRPVVDRKGDKPTLEVKSVIDAMDDLLVKMQKEPHKGADHVKKLRFELSRFASAQKRAGGSLAREVAKVRRPIAVILSEMKQYVGSLPHHMDRAWFSNLSSDIMSLLDTAEELEEWV